MNRLATLLVAGLAVATGVGILSLQAFCGLRSTPAVEPGEPPASSECESNWSSGLLAFPGLTLAGATGLWFERRWIGFVAAGLLCAYGFLLMFSMGFMGLIPGVLLLVASAFAPDRAAPPAADSRLR